jgi:hypothetical protein
MLQALAEVFWAMPAKSKVGWTRMQEGKGLEPWGQCLAVVWLFEDPEHTA